MPSDLSPVSPPAVTVLLATFNGAEWLDDQLDSILSQEGVSVRVVALDDASTDGTRAILTARAAADPRVVVLPDQGPSGGSAANFYRLVRSVPVESGYVSFADQDDVWRPGKLARHVGILQAGGHDGVSSSVMAFAPDGTTALVRKDFPQRRFDFLTESPGPGSTFVLTPRLVDLARAELNDPESPAGKADFHDSLIYVIGRARGWSWHIDGEPSVDYRQHGANVMGSNVGLRSALARLGLIRARWHRNQAILHATVALRVAPPESRAGLERMLALLESRGFRARWALARAATQMRRRPRDQRIIGVLIAIGVW
jgi:rhamnosyltransferase